jgi:hypothetical protein
MKESRSFFEKKEPKKHSLPCGPVWHRPGRIELIKFFLLLFCSQKRRVFSSKRLPLAEPSQPAKQRGQ